MSFISNNAVTIELDSYVMSQNNRIRDIVRINKLWNEDKFQSYLEMYKSILYNVVIPASNGYTDEHSSEPVLDNVFDFHTILLVAENYAKRIQHGKLAEALSTDEDSLEPIYEDIDYSDWLTSY